ncbi:MAG: hypothetical protein R3D60_09995 [Paracoccaceae bacterium]
MSCVPSSLSRSLVPVVALLAGLAGPVWAQQTPLQAQLGTIEAFLDAGDAEGAMNAARALVRLVGETAGFGVWNARLTQDVATGFGVNVPRADNVYAPGEPIYAYVEPFGYSLSPIGGGENQLLFEVSFTIDDPDGRQLTQGMIDMGQINLRTRGEPVDAFFHLTYNITGVSGPATLRTEVIDVATGQVDVFTLPVVFASPPAPAAPSK